MRLEEIRDALDDSHPSEFEYDKIAYRRLMERIDNAIAERALPVTREWMNANFKLECDDDWSVDLGEVFARMWLRSDGLLRLSVTSSALTVSTRGQLLDLLSGLGVRK